MLLEIPFHSSRAVCLSVQDTFKNQNIKTINGRLPPRNIAELKMWDTVYLYLIGPYIEYIRQHQLCGAILKNNVSLACMTMICPATGWFEIFKVPMYDLDEVTGGSY